MGENFAHEIVPGQVLTGMEPQAPTETSMMGIPMSQPNPSKHITRPTFMSAFLQNLGPALAGGAGKESFSAGVGGALQGIEEQKRHKQSYGLQQEALSQKGEIAQANLGAANARQQSLFFQQQLLEAQRQAGLNSRASGVQEGANTRAELAVTPEKQAFNSLVKSGMNEADAFKTITDSKKNPTMAGIMLDAANGDPKSQAVLKKIQDDKVQITNINANRFLNRLVTAINNDTGQVENITEAEVVRRSEAGENLQPIGRPSAQFVQGVQRTVSEVPASVSRVREKIGAYDNPNDRAILAKVAGSLGSPESGGLGIVGWLRNLTDQSVKGGLSEQGQDLLVRLGSLAEIAGSMRSTLGIAATQSLTEQIQSLVPGATTPNSKVAIKQLDNFYQLAQRAVGTPLGKKVGGTIPSDASAIPFTPRQ